MVILYCTVWRLCYTLQLHTSCVIIDKSNAYNEIKFDVIRNIVSPLFYNLRCQMKSLDISTDLDIGISFFFAATHSRSIVILLHCYAPIYSRTLYLSISS